MKKLFAIVCALVLALSLSASALAADITTIEEGKFIYSTSPDFRPLSTPMTTTISSASSPRSLI